MQMNIEGFSVCRISFLFVFSGDKIVRQRKVLCVYNIVKTTKKSRHTAPNVSGCNAELAIFFLIVWMSTTSQQMFFIRTELAIHIVVSPFVSYVQDFVLFHLERLHRAILLGYKGRDFSSRFLILSVVLSLVMQHPLSLLIGNCALTSIHIIPLQCFEFQMYFGCLFYWISESVLKLFLLCCSVVFG